MIIAARDGNDALVKLLIEESADTASRTKVVPLRNCPPNLIRPEHSIAHPTS